MDKLSAHRRSWNMGRIKGKDTKPEMKLRTVLHRLGYRYRLNQKNLPGKPDLVFAKYRTVIFVHGCFWHQHEQCREGRLPSSNLEYWKPKLEKNVLRDIRNKAMLESLGWQVITIWECELQHIDTVIQKILTMMPK